MKNLPRLLRITAFLATLASLALLAPGEAFSQKQKQKRGPVDDLLKQKPVSIVELDSPKGLSMDKFLAGAKALKGGNYVFIYGVGLGEMTPSSEYVLAYPKDVPEKGGAVLMGDVTIKLMSASDFKSAKLAKPKS